MCVGFRNHLRPHSEITGDSPGRLASHRATSRKCDVKRVASHQDQAQRITARRKPHSHVNIGVGGRDHIDAFGLAFPAW